MPFKNFINANFRPEPVDVEIQFTGLLMLRPGAAIGPAGETECKAGVIMDPNNNHELNIDVTDSNDEKVPIPTTVGSNKISPSLRIYAGDAAGNPLPQQRGVTKFLSTDPSAGQFPGQEGNHRLDFRWAVDLKAFHQAATVDLTKLTADITLTDGLLFTAQRTDLARSVVKLVRPGALPPFFDLNRIETTIGANIYLDAGTFLVLEWNDNGTRKWLLPKGGIDGGAYRVHVDNGPKDSTVHDELELHYFSLSAIPAAQHFGLRFYSSGPFSILASVDAPCMATAFDGDGRT